MRSRKSLFAVDTERDSNVFVLKQHFYRWQIKSEFMVILKAENMFLFLPACRVVSLHASDCHSVYEYSTSVCLMSELKCLVKSFLGVNRESIDPVVFVYLLLWSSHCTIYNVWGQSLCTKYSNVEQLNDAKLMMLNENSRRNSVWGWCIQGWGPFLCLCTGSHFLITQLCMPTTTSQVACCEKWLLRSFIISQSKHCPVRLI